MKTKLIIPLFLGLLFELRAQNFTPVGGGFPNDAAFGPGNGSVSIAPPPASPPFLPQFRLHVVENDAAASTGLTSGYFEYISASSTSNATAVAGYANGSSSTASKRSVGVEGIAESAAPNSSSSFNYGINGIANGGGVNHGGHFIGFGATDPTAGENVGIFGTINSAGGLINTGVYGDDGTFSTANAGYFKGSVKVLPGAGTDATILLNNNSAVEWGLYSVFSSNHFEIRENGITPAAVTILDGAGNNNVGINQSSPTARLHVTDAGSGTGSGFFEFSRSGSGTFNALNAENTMSGTGGNARGVRGFATGAGATNIGVYGIIGSSGTGISAGVYGDIAFAPGANDYAGYFNGKVTVNGVFTSLSDRRLKENILPLENILDKVKLLKPSSYSFKSNEYKGLHLPEGKQMGLIAQELEEVFPELVSEVKGYTLPAEGKVPARDIPDHKTVNYLGLIPVLIASIQEQQVKIEKLEAQLASSSQTGINNNSPGTSTFGMEQNIPNPFSHETVIKYNLPAKTGSAMICIYDLSGKQLSTFPLNDMGASSLTITSENLAAGIYIYSIIADGKLVDSKRMIVAEK